MRLFGNTVIQAMVSFGPYPVFLLGRSYFELQHQPWLLVSSWAYFTLMAASRGWEIGSVTTYRDVSMLLADFWHVLEALPFPSWMLLLFLRCSALNSFPHMPILSELSFHNHCVKFEEAYASWTQTRGDFILPAEVAWEVFALEFRNRLFLVKIAIGISIGIASNL